MKLPLIVLGVLSAAVVHAQSALPGQTGNAMPTNPNLPTVWLIGDSTVRNGTGYGGADGQWGWGAPIEYEFDLAKINVVNRALGGTSSRTFYNSNWPGVVANVKKGDFVIMQFGHNDNNGVFTGAGGYRASLNGIGDDTQEVDNARSGQKDTVHSFGWYLKQFVEETKAKGATPIICSLIPRKIWADGKIVRVNDNYFPYGKWAGQVAEAENIAFVDLNEITARKYDALGEKKVEPMFVPVPTEHTHTDWYGAIINAESVISGLKALKNNPLAEYFSAAAKLLPAADVNTPALDGTSTVQDAERAAAARAAAPAAAAETAPPVAAPASVAGSSARADLPSLFVVGDSTASSPLPIQGWGTPFPNYFDLSKINVLNRAHGGASARSFMNAYWPAMMKEIKPGDFVLVQFGHNDGGTPGQGTRPERPDLSGLGEDTMDITDANGNPETVHSFGWYMRKYIADAHAKGATVIIVTPTPTNNWANGKINRGLGNYGPWSIQTAQAQNVPMVDFNDIVADKYDAMGQDALASLYSTDRTHSTPAGADFNAANVVAGLKALPGNPLGKYLSAKGQSEATADTKWVAENAAGSAPAPATTSAAR